MVSHLIFAISPLLAGWVLDLIFGDPQRLPHPIVWFGKAIAWCERRFNRGTPRERRQNGAIVAVGLILAVYLLCSWLLWFASIVPVVELILQAIIIFFCLAGTTLCREVAMVFFALERSLDDGRRQLSRIVGRDTSNLSANEVRTAALETLAENLSDGVVAPLFWYAILGVPGMAAYKMVNTLDSMIAYRNERYLNFGRWAAKIDDIANWIPARLTAILMLLAACKPKLWGFVRHYGKAHLSPNSGWPEAALAGILNCRFGGPHDYFGECVPKPYIGDNPRQLTFTDLTLSLRIARTTEVIAIALILLTKI